MGIVLTDDEKFYLGKWIEQQAQELTTADTTLFKEYVVEVLARVDCDPRSTSKDVFGSLLQRSFDGILENVPLFLENLYSALISKNYMPQRRSSFVLVTKVPVYKIDVLLIKKNFEKFGGIVSIKADYSERKLLIEFKNPFCALRCTKSSQPFFENRFVSVELFNDSPAEFQGVDINAGGVLGSSQCQESNVHIRRDSDPSHDAASTEEPPTPPKEQSQEIQHSAEPQTTHTHSVDSKAYFAKRVEQVQSFQQAVFEGKRKEKQQYQEQLSQLIASKEKLLHVYREKLVKLCEAVAPLDTTDNQVSTLSNEFDRIIQEMGSLQIMPDTMVKHKLEKYNLENPQTSTMIKDAQMKQIKNKNKRKSKKKFFKAKKRIRKHR